MNLPMVCDNCHAVYPSGFVIEGPGEVRDLRLSSVSVGPPCPECGGRGTIPDGLYESVDGVVRALDAPGGLPALQELAALLERWQEQPPSPAEAVETLRSQSPPLASMLEQYRPKDSAALAGWIAVFLMIVQLIIGCQQRGDQVDVTIIERRVTEAVEQHQAKPAAGDERGHRDRPAGGR